MAFRVSFSIDPPYGFHRTITTSITLKNLELVEELQCIANLYYKFPVLVFVDPYELTNYRHLYTFQHHGNPNLELPVAAMDSNGTSLLLSLASVGPQVDVKVPVHFRYGEISHSNSETHRSAELAWPDLFLSCSSSVPKAKGLLSYEPPEEFASSLGDHYLYTPLQTFDAEPSARFAVVVAPVGQSTDLAQVRFGTVFTIAAMFGYLAYVSYMTARRLRKVEKVD
ncbi:PIG-X [Lentinula detonsa]|uniref:Protein PBN1 n=1 Tax=Lentinula detonsa TaxID=2804962 RepID=A0AA38Q4L5_9AGAR|nr:PIG-X [Lentinula detonsa]